jgi:methyl-accepting chemotaxis protein
MADIVQGVSAASAGQNTGIEQVSGAITQMDQATSQIAGPCRGSSGRHGRLGKGLMQG